MARTHNTAALWESPTKRPRPTPPRPPKPSEPPAHPPATPSAPSAPSPDTEGPFLRAEAIVGRGSFGTVRRALLVGTDLHVAVKTVKERDSWREVDTLKALRGSPNVVCLLGCFWGDEEQEADRMVNLVLEYLPDTLQRIIRHHRHALKRCVEPFYTRVYMYQIFRGLASLGRHGVVHRDIKPANLLVDPSMLMLKICDFGTAKMMDRAESSQPYVCSRYYRAPELILSAPDYSVAVDLWSAGCVMAELLISVPIFAGHDGVDQLEQICQVLGTPTKEELNAMNPDYHESVAFEPVLPPLPWRQVLGEHQPDDVVELIGKMLRFDPSQRWLALEALGAPFFDEVRMNARRLELEHLTLTPEELVGLPSAFLTRLAPLTRKPPTTA